MHLRPCLSEKRAGLSGKSSCVAKHRMAVDPTLLAPALPKLGHLQARTCAIGTAVLFAIPW